MIDIICLDENYATTRLVVKSLQNHTKHNSSKLHGGLRSKGYFKYSYTKKNARQINSWHIQKDNQLEESANLLHPLYKDIQHNLPLITIITVVYNGATHIEETIQSVISQSYQNIEYLIIDGGSSDETINILKKYDNKIDYWISEPDKGIYDAMNKGIKHCNGDYIFFLGADDRLMKNAIESILKKLHFTIKNELIALPVCIDNYRIAKPDITIPVPVIHHQGALFNTSNIKSLSGFSSKYKIHADFDLMSAYIIKYGFKYINQPLCIFYKGGTSTNGQNTFLSIKELLTIYFQYNGKLFSSKWIILIARPLFYLLSMKFNK